MTTIRTANNGRLTIAEAKRLILDNSPRESFAQVYRRDDGELVVVPDAEPKSIFAGHLDEDFASNCAQLGIVPRWKYRPGLTGYTGDPETDERFTISGDELARLAELHGVTLDAASLEPRKVEGHRLWTLVEAVKYLTALDSHGVAPERLLKRAAKAAADRTLTLIDPESGERRHGDNLSGFLVEWVRAEDFNRWLASEGIREPYRLPDDPPSEQSQPEPGAVKAAPPEPPETTRQRRARLLAMLETESAAGGKHGALARVTAIEKQAKPTADRANIAKDIRKAREERDAERRGGALTRLLK